MNQRIIGAFLSYVLIAVKLGVALGFTPILISSLGKDGYGLYSIVGSLVAYLYVLDLGLNDSVLRFFVAHEAQVKKRNHFLGQMLFFYSLLGFLVVIAGWSLANLTLLLFGSTLNTEQLGQMRQMVLILTFGAAFLIAFNPVLALITAAEKFFFLRVVDIAMTLISTGVILLLLWNGFGEVMVVTVMAGGMVVQVVLRICYVVGRMRIPILYRLPELGELKKVLIYSVPIFVSVLVEAIYWKLDNIIIGALIGAAPVGIYAIGIMFNKYFMSFATAISRLMTPEVIRKLDAGVGASGITSLLIRVSRAQAMLLLLVLLGLFSFGQRFIFLWLGADFSKSYFVMLIVVAPYTLELIGNVRNIVLQVKGLYWHRVLIIGVSALVNIPLTIFLLPVSGVLGAAMATGAGIIVGYVLVAVMLSRRVGLEMGRYYKELLRGIWFVASVMLFVGIGLDRMMPGGWIGLCSCVVLYTAIYFGGIIAFAANLEERATIRKVINLLGGRFFVRG